MATSQSQHRCVFVGNIPYDATEEQLMQICEEVGPVVSFRLVVDRETGKPKGYGFCEYKDEETALSARRNLQGYEINGRQLRVDFAENDKNNEGRGGSGSGSATNVDPVNQSAAPAGLGRQNLDQPIGYSVAMAAATVMTGALGASQTASVRSQVGLHSQSSLGTDPLTRHLSMMSKSQLTEIVSEFKAMATQNKEQTRQLLVAIPSLAKALFQVEVMLGMVSPQLLMMPNNSSQPLTQNVQTLPGLPPLPQNKIPLGVQNVVQENRISTGLPSQYPIAPQLNQVVQKGQHNQTGASSHATQHLGGSTSFSQHLHHPSALMHPQPASTSSAIPGKMDEPGHNVVVGGKARIMSSSTDQLERSEKLMKLNDGRASSSPATHAPPTQIQIPRNVDSILLQQVVSLTAEQLRSLPPDQQQQVIQLQQMLRQVR